MCQSWLNLPWPWCKYDSSISSAVFEKTRPNRMSSPSLMNKRSPYLVWEYWQLSILRSYTEPSIPVRLTFRRVLNDRPAPVVPVVACWQEYIYQHPVVPPLTSKPWLNRGDTIRQPCFLPILLSERIRFRGFVSMFLYHPISSLS